MTQIILASASPRREDLLKLLGVSFSIVPANIDESLVQSDSPQGIVEELALKKAQVVAQDYMEDLVIAADTLVAIGQEVLGKPKDKQDAQEMLEKLSGDQHQVYSAYAIIYKGELDIVRSFATNIEFFELSPAYIQTYLSTKEPYDKAGAYALQGIACQFVKNIQGSHTNVIGLNIGELKQDFIRLQVLRG